jgi:serine/threonine-protein kinase
MMASHRLGPYQLLGAVATDRCGCTYRARREGSELGYLVKTARPGGTISAAAARQLERERDELLAVRHPLLPILVEWVQDGDEVGLVWLDPGGHRLDAILARSRRLDWEVATAVAIEVGRALAVLHRAGETHGALRAELVEITEQGTVCLHGLGTHPPGSDADGDPELALPDQLSPEQLLGEEPTARSDLFLLGVLLYRMLAGCGPFEGEPAGISQRIRHAPHNPLARRAPAVPKALGTVVARCLRKRPASRYPDAVSVVTLLTGALRAHTTLPLDLLVSRALARADLGSELGAPAEPGVGRDGSPRPRWHRQLLLPATLLLAAMVGGMLLWQSLREAQPPEPGDVRGIVKRPALVRVLARPWAEVHVDGQPIDVTPMARPIEVTPGRHVLVFRHPNAPDERREIEIVAGETILLDVDMRVTRPADAGRIERRDGGEDDSP